jgi:tetratricopeptide (TPR) repeat protein
MSDPLRTEPPRASEPASKAERDAKIEQLLLAGLDHYFAAEYDQAINIWTRALFLDRSHPKARAYIERARSAQAERQREHEALLHDSAAAIGRGDSAEARRLLRLAMSHGGPSDEVMVLLDRAERLESGTEARPVDRVTEAPRLTLDVLPPVRPSRAAWLAIAAFGLVVVAAGVFATSAMRPEWAALVERSLTRRVDRGATPPPQPTDVPPVPGRPSAALARAQALVTSGRLRDAMPLLASIPHTAPERAEADRLLAEVQRQLIGLGPLPATRSAVPTTGGVVP